MVLINNFTKKFGDQVALDHLELKVDEDEIYCSRCTNGTGKTTAINLPLGIILPTSGAHLSIN